MTILNVNEIKNKYKKYQEYINDEEFINYINDFYISIVVEKEQEIIDIIIENTNNSIAFINFDFNLNEILEKVNKRYNNISIFNITFNNLIFTKKFNFYNIKFSINRFIFTFCYFNEFSFNANKIDYQLSFISCYFYNHIYFIFSKIENLIVFNKTHFYEEINFIEFDIIGKCKFELVEYINQLNLI